jgi:molybdate transport system ATP-binding protein
MLEAWIQKRRRAFTVDVRIRLEAGGCLSLFGASGSGKSTILSCIAGVEQPDPYVGLIRFEGMQFYPPSLPLHLRRVGYLTQEPHLFPHLTVEGNIRFGLEQNDEAWLAQLRDSLGIGDIWRASAARISGGQARRVAVARMLARRPRLVLLDEPFTGLDRALVRDLIQALVRWREELGFSMIVVDHEAEILERLCSRVAFIEEGRIAQEGTWDEIRAAPVNESLRGLLRPL